MSTDYKFLRSVTGPQLQRSGSDLPRYPTLNITGGLSILDEPSVPRYTLSVGDISENTTIVDLYNKTGKPRVAVQKSIILNGRTTNSGSSLVNAWLADSSYGGVKQNGTDSSRHYFIDLDLPNSIRLDSLTASITPASTHTGLPTVMPGITLFYVSGTTKTVISAQSSSVLTFGEYNTTHNISMSLSGATVNHSYKYTLQLKGEGFANAVTGLIFNSVNMNWTAPSGAYGT